MAAGRLRLESRGKKGMTLKRLLTRFRETGPLRAAKIAYNGLEGIWFDLVHGTDTFQRVPLDQLILPPDNRDHARKYDPSPVGPFRRILAGLSVRPSDVFVDFGCGKGRVLLLASHFPFRRVVGVEFSSELCAVARANVEAYSRRRRVRAPIEVVPADAARFPIQDDFTFFYFFNPFDELIMRSVFANIAGSWRRLPRRMIVIYYVPLWRAAIEDLGIFILRGDYTLMERRFLVYESRPA